LKDDPVLNQNVLVGYDALNSGELMSLRVPMSSIVKPLEGVPSEALGTTEEAKDKPSHLSSLSASTMSVLKACLD
jgi:hypothetical protein